MVKGLDLFREHFVSFKDQYILIGGAACDLLFEEFGAEFRATRDLDIVLCLETLDQRFTEAFWTFVEAGGYEMRERSSGRPEFFRFQKPKDPNYPFMLELFSRKPDVLSIPVGQHVTPIPLGEESSNLSAILLSDDYYRMLRGGVKDVQGIPVVGPEYMILLKAHAFLDLRGEVSRSEIHEDSNGLRYVNRGTSAQVISLGVSNLGRHVVTDPR